MTELRNLLQLPTGYGSPLPSLRPQVQAGTFAPQNDHVMTPSPTVGAIGDDRFANNNVGDGGAGGGFGNDGGNSVDPGVAGTIGDFSDMSWSGSGAKAGGTLGGLALGPIGMIGGTVIGGVIGGALSGPTHSAPDPAGLDAPSFSDISDEIDAEIDAGLGGFGGDGGDGASVGDPSAGDANSGGTGFGGGSDGPF